MSTDAPTQVFVVTLGIYSGYGIDSIWLTLEDAQAAVGDSDDSDGYGKRIEVWPVGENEQTMGGFSRSAEFDAKTGELLSDNTGDIWPQLREERVYVQKREDPFRVTIYVEASSRERVNKVFSEARARVLAGISEGLYPEPYHPA